MGDSYRLRLMEAIANYDPSQPRDKGGKWTSRGGETLLSASRSKSGKWKMPDGSDAPEHIQKLGIPPAWKDVYVNPNPGGDMLARGKDAKGRLQIRYSDSHNMKAAADKFGRVSELRTKRKQILSEMDQDAKKGGASREHAECLRTIVTTGIRPGSDKDTKAAKKAFGATTLEGRHVVVTGGEVRLQFTGKKGVDLDIPVYDQKTANILVNRAASAGSTGRLFKTDAAALRDYSKSKDGGGFKTKDHRTALGTETALTAVNRMKAPTDVKSYKAQVKSVATEVSGVLGNTPAIALKAYIDPSIFSNWRASAGV